MREETRGAWRGKKPDAPLQGNDRGQKALYRSAIPSIVRGPTPCVTASGKRATDLGYRHHDGELLRAGRSSAETVKQADRAEVGRYLDDFASLAMATRRPDKPMRNGWPEFSAWTSSQQRCRRVVVTAYNA